MTKFVVFHLHLDDAQAGEFNAGKMTEDQSHAVLDAVQGRSAKGAMKHDFYRPVAVVDAKRIDDVFRETNHIDHDWTRNASIVRVEGPARSTSVGDVTVEVDTGAVWSCANMGWDKIEDPELVGGFRREAKSFSGQS